MAHTHPSTKPPNKYPLLTERRSRAPLLLQISLIAFILAALIYLVSGTNAPSSGSKRDSAPSHLDFYGHLTESSKEQRGNGTGIGHELGRRALAPAEIQGDRNMRHYRDKGKELVCLMLADLNDAQHLQKQYSYSDIRTFSTKPNSVHDWRPDPNVDNSDYNMRHMSAPNVDYLNKLNGVEGVRDRSIIVKLDNPRFKWRLARYNQDGGYFVNEGPDLRITAHEPTNAHYTFVTSFKNRVLVVLDALSPKESAPDVSENQLPVIRKLSDALFIHYLRTASTSLTVGQGSENPRVPRARTSSPQWFVVREVSGPPDSLSVISWCLRHYGWNQDRLPQYNERITWPIGSYCYYAILGTSNSASLAMFLIEHKYRIHEAVLGSVTMWGSGSVNGQGFELPTLLWWATELRLRMTELEEANSSYETPRAFADSIHDWPHKLTPVHAP